MRRWPYSRALTVALDLVTRLAPACERIAVAGSIRRGAPYVKDIEIVAEPIVGCDLLGGARPGPTALDCAIEELDRDVIVVPRKMANGSTWRGDRYKALIDTASAIPIDLFIVRPPAQWGPILAIRTGPHDFSRHLVTACRARGLRCVGGRLVHDRGAELVTPEERDFFRGLRHRVDRACGARRDTP